jgi:hypothetical protein
MDTAAGMLGECRIGEPTCKDRDCGEALHGDILRLI